MKISLKIIVVLVMLSSFTGKAQQIPIEKIIESSKLSKYLTKDVQKQLKAKGAISEAKLAEYFRLKFTERYFYDWNNVDERFKEYQDLYSNKESSHLSNANDHLNKYNGETKWKLPFNYLNGEPVNAYALRHLARSHKMVDIAFQYFYQEKEDKFLTYFLDQRNSLNEAFSKGDFEKIEDGNGVYEAFRSGYRVLNWLQIHNLFLGEELYPDDDQLKTIATLLQHGAHLYSRNKEFKSGNHQTRGLSALAMLSILFRDFEGADEWYNHSMQLLGEHMNKEINEDGFQFERTVHYHISDIGNYFYVYQLAQKSQMKVDEDWKVTLNSLFETLVKIAYPDKSAPVFSDDTDTPWAEKNDISNALTLGYVLFQNPSYGYFSNSKVEAKMYWYLDAKQLESLGNIKSKKPVYESVEFPETGYYFMREGWEKNDKLMVISAGLDDKKPDHQHGDMLGIQAMAYGNVILPNYQVRYYLKDLELFKNSLTKNVALVDNELQGKQYTSNKGGSGFGKFRKLPMPNVISWGKENGIEHFVGSHNGFENIGVKYSRQLINIENKFWIVKDNFSSKELHNYKQVWQGHYSLENAPNLLRATFDNGSGLDIVQLNAVDKIENSGARGKEWSIVSKEGNTEFSFITILFPFSKFDDSINEEEAEMKSIIDWNLVRIQSNSDRQSYLFEKENMKVAFDALSINFSNSKLTFESPSDVLVIVKNDAVWIQNIQSSVVNLSFKGSKIKIEPGKKEKLN